MLEGYDLGCSTQPVLHLVQPALLQRAYHVSCSHSIAISCISYERVCELVHVAPLLLCVYYSVYRSKGLCLFRSLGGKVAQEPVAKSQF